MTRRTCWCVAYLALAAALVLLMAVPAPAGATHCGVVASSSCGVVTSSYPVYSKPVVVTKTVTPLIQRYVAVVPLLEVPTYSAVYVPPVVPVNPGVAAGVGVAAQAPPAAAGLAPGDVQKIMGALTTLNNNMRGFNDRLSALEARVGAGPAPPAAAPRAAATPPREAVTPPPPPPMPRVEAAAPASGPGGVLSLVQGKCASCHEARVSAEKGGGLTLTEGNVLARLTDRQVNKVIGSAYKGTMPPKSSGVAPLTDEEVSALVSHYSK